MMPKSSWAAAMALEIWMACGAIWVRDWAATTMAKTTLSVLVSLQVLWQRIDSGGHDLVDGTMEEDMNLVRERQGTHVTMVPGCAISPLAYMRIPRQKASAYALKIAKNSNENSKV